MFRRFVIFLNVFTFAFIQTAMAAPPIPPTNQMTGYIEFLKDSGVTQHAVSLKEIHQKYGGSLPPTIRAEMDALLKENPDMMVPKMDVQHIGQGKDEHLQIDVNTPQGSVVITTSNSDKAPFSVVGRVNGAPVKTDITYSQLVYAQDMVYSERVNQKWSRSPLVHYDGKDFLKLDNKSKKEYIKQMRALAGSIEAVQRSLHPLKKVSSNDYFYENIFGNSAAAADDCTTAGWSDGTFGANNVCFSPKIAHNSAICPEGEIQCNPVFYGDGLCTKGTDTSKWTQKCNEQDANLDNVIKSYAGYQTDDASISKAFDDIGKAAHNLIPSCAKASAQATNPDQISTCNEFLPRIGMMNNLCGQTGIAEKYKNACPALPAPAVAPTEKAAAGGEAAHGNNAAPAPGGKEAAQTRVANNPPPPSAQGPAQVPPQSQTPAQVATPPADGSPAQVGPCSPEDRCCHFFQSYNPALPATKSYCTTGSASAADLDILRCSRDDKPAVDYEVCKDKSANSCAKYHALTAETVKSCAHATVVACQTPGGNEGFVQACTDCAPGYDPDRAGMVTVNSCDARSGQVASDKHSRRDHEHEHKEKSFWDRNSSWLLPALLFAGVGLMMYMQYRSQKNYMNQMAAYNQQLYGGYGYGSVASPSIIYYTPGITAPPPASREFTIPSMNRGAT